MPERRVLVTGSSRGIGKGIALRLAAEGWRVALHCNNRIDEARAVLGDSAAGVYACDLSDPSLVAEFAARVLSDGPLHALVNNAGIYEPLSFAGASEASFSDSMRRTFAVNVESPVRLMRSVLGGFSSAGGGKILNVASRVGFKGEAGAALYAASKAALINLTRSLAVELAPMNVGVFGMAPGWVDTAMARDGMNDRLPEILSGLPLGRMASVDDCAAVAAFLLRDEASYLSGQVIDINGASYFH